MRGGPFEKARAIRVIEDVIRIHPDGATEDVLLGRLARVGVDERTTHVILAEMVVARRLRREGERWRLEAR